MRTSSTRTVSAVIVEPLDQALELFDLLATQALSLRKMSNERCYPAAEQTVDEVAALRVDVVLARNQGPIKIAPPVGLRGQRLLFHEPGEEGADRAGRPLAVVVHLSDDVLRAEWSRGAPE